MLYGGENVLPGNLCHIVGYAVFIVKFRLFKVSSLVLYAEEKKDSRIYYRLTFQDIKEKFPGDVYVRENLQIWSPACFRAGLLLFAGFFFQSADVVSLFKVEVIFIPVANDLDVHKLRGKLCRTKSQTVESERIFVGFSVGVVFSAGVKLAVYKLPVVAFFVVVEVNGAASSEILHFYVVIAVVCYDDLIAEACPGLVYGVGNNLKDGVFAAVKTVRAKNNRRTFTNLIRTFQHSDAVVSVILFLSHFSSFL